MFASKIIYLFIIGIVIAVILYPDFSLHTERFVVKGVPGAYKLNISHLLQVCTYV